MACAGIAVVHGFRRHWGSWNASLTDMGRGDCVYAFGTLCYSRISMVEMLFMLCTHMSLTRPVVRSFRLVAFTLWKLEDATG